jgi:hypothetical protein
LKDVTSLQAFLNMKLIAESEGATLRDAVRLVVFVTDMFRFRPLVNKGMSARNGGAGGMPVAARLQDAVRQARIEMGERSGVVVDLRDATLTRLEIQPSLDRSSKSPTTSKSSTAPSRPAESRDCGST